MRRWELGVSAATWHWMTCMCQMEPALSQVGACVPSTPWGHVATGMETALPSTTSTQPHVRHNSRFHPASCDFEWDTCGWSSPSDERLHGFTWGWKSGVPLAKYPGPEQDHTLGTEDGRRTSGSPGVVWGEQQELWREGVTRECPLHSVPGLKGLGCRSVPLSALSQPQVWAGPYRTDPMRAVAPQAAALPCFEPQPCIHCASWL